MAARKLKVPLEYRQGFSKATKKMKKLERKFRIQVAQKAIGRPRIGEGSIYMNMSIEKGLLRILGAESVVCAGPRWSPKR